MKLSQIPLLFFSLLFFASGSLIFATLFFRNPLYNSSHSFFSYPKNNDCIWCDRTDNDSDVCFMSGDVRTHSPSSSIILYATHANVSDLVAKEERIRPYTRKWETPLMETIDEISLRTTASKELFRHHKCDMQHDAPALVFSAAGYTGNLFHSFNNVILPLYITSQHLNRRVVLVVLRYQEWWYRKYEAILSQLTDYPIVDFSNDMRTHCFPAAIVGLRFHGTLTIYPERLRGHKNISDFQRLLAKAYEPNRRIKDDNGTKKNHTPKLVIISRKGTREIENERDMVQLGKELRFDVEVLRPNDTMLLKDIYDTLSTCDVAIGVHGAALTHFLFMRPGSTLIQIEPLGIKDQAWECFGEPASKMGIQYVNYKIDPRESSLLYRKYPNSGKKTEKKKGWKHIKEMYLEGQNVTLDLNRLKVVLAQVIN